VDRYKTLCILAPEVEKRNNEKEELIGVDLDCTSELMYSKNGERS
jgi:hypothetical protein